jgi:hypothetical protein
MKDYSNVKLEKNYQISVYDGSYEDYKYQSDPNKKKPEEVEEDKDDDDCVIF